MGRKFTKNDPVFYVYAHTEGNEIVYIGKGNGCRAYRVRYGCGGRGSNPDHLAWKERQILNGKLPHEWVSFLFTGLIEQEALELERSAIAQHKPRFNKAHNPDYSFSSFWTEDLVLKAKQLREEGMSHKNIAKILGTSTMTVHRRLSSNDQQ